MEERRLTEIGDGEGHGPGIDPQRLCDAASSVFFAIVRYQAVRMGKPVPLPLILCPKSVPPCPCSFSREEVREAEMFLRRLGVISGKTGSDMPVVDI